MLRKVNVQVLEDIQDFILLKGFGNKSESEIKRIIQQNLNEKRSIERQLMEEVKEEDDPIIKGKEEDRKRNFLNEKVGRPHKKVWNFIQEDGSEYKVEHVLRENANPHLAYEDGRIQVLIDIIETLADHIKSYQDETWKTLNDCTLRIFQADEDGIKAQLEELEEKKKEAQ